jgi:P27 family predicted phage terminase small subunit
MARGRKPINKQTLELRGSWRAGTKKLSESAPEKAGRNAPTCPRYLTGEAKTIWNYLAPKMKKLGILDKTHRVTLEIYCVTYQRWRTAEKQAKSIMKKSKKGTFYQNPYLSVAERAIQTLVKVGNELGLTPKAMHGLKLQTAKPKKTDSKNSIFVDSA